MRASDERLLQAPARLVLGALAVGAAVGTLAGSIVASHLRTQQLLGTATPDSGPGPTPTGAPSPPPLPPAAPPAVSSHVLQSLGTVANLTADIGGEPWLFLVGSDSGFIDLLLNAMLSLEDHGLEHAVVVICYDQATCDFLANTGIPTIRHAFYEDVAKYVYDHIDCPEDQFMYKLDGNTSTTGEPPPGDYVKAVVFLSRILVHAELVDKDISFFTFDADTVFTRDLRGVFVRPDADIVTAADVGGLSHPGFSHYIFANSTGLGNVELRLNDGIASFRVTDKIKGLLGKGYARVIADLCLRGGGQSAFNDLLFDDGFRFEFVPGAPMIEMSTGQGVADELVATKNGTAVRTLPFSDYYNTCLRDLVHVSLSEASLVHPNCRPGLSVEADMTNATKTEAKIQFFKESGLWFLRDDFREVAQTGNRTEFLAAIRRD